MKKLKHNKIKQSDRQLKHIAVTADNYLRLKGFGKFGESFNDVITQVIQKSKLQSDSQVGPGDQIATDYKSLEMDYSNE